MNIDDKKLDIMLKDLASQEHGACKELEDDIIMFAEFKQGLSEPEINQVEIHLKECKRCQGVYDMALKDFSSEETARIDALGHQIYNKQFVSPKEVFKAAMQKGKSQLEAFINATETLFQPRSLAFAQRKGDQPEVENDSKLARQTTYTLEEPSPAYEITILAKAAYLSILLARPDTSKVKVLVSDKKIEAAGRDHKILQTLSFDETDVGPNTIIFIQSEKPLDIDLPTISFQKLIEIFGNKGEQGFVSQEAILVNVQK